MRAIDISVHQGLLSWSKWQDFYDADIRLAIVGSQQSHTINPYVRENLYRARSTGLLTATYAWLAPARRTGEESITRAHYWCGDEWEHLLFCALDVEERGVGTVADWFQNIADAEATLDALGKGSAKVIYSGAYAWRDIIGVNHTFYNHGLWLAYEDFDPDIDEPPIDMGWPVAPIAAQYDLDTNFLGVQVDLNEFDDAWIVAITQPPTPPEPEPEPEPDPEPPTPPGGDMDEETKNKLRDVMNILREWRGVHELRLAIAQAKPWIGDDTVSRRQAEDCEDLAHRIGVIVGDEPA